MNNKQILTVATDVGYMLLKSGAEVYRAEQSVEYICQSYGVKEIDVFAIPSSIIATISFGDDFISKTKRISESEIDLEKVDKLNELSRYICENKPEYDEIQAKLREIERIKSYPFFYKTIAYALVSSSFTVLFEGSWIESLIGFFIGVIISFIMYFAEKRNYNPFLKIAFCSFVISLIAVLFEIGTNGFINSDKLITGSLMILVPGIAITNCMRDYMAKDFMSGTAKLAEAVMIALATALGVAVVLLSVYQWGGL